MQDNYMWQFRRCKYWRSKYSLLEKKVTLLTNAQQYIFNSEQNNIMQQLYTAPCTSVCGRTIFHTELLQFLTFHQLHQDCGQTTLPWLRKLKKNPNTECGNMPPDLWSKWLKVSTLLLTSRCELWLILSQLLLLKLLTTEVGADWIRRKDQRGWYYLYQENTQVIP